MTQPQAEQTPVFPSQPQLHPQPQVAGFNCGGWRYAIGPQQEELDELEEEEEPLSEPDELPEDEPEDDPLDPDDELLLLNEPDEELDELPDAEEPLLLNEPDEEPESDAPDDEEDPLDMARTPGWLPQSDWLREDTDAGGSATPTSAQFAAIPLVIVCTYVYYIARLIPRGRNRRNTNVFSTN